MRRLLVAGLAAVTSWMSAGNVTAGDSHSQTACSDCNAAVREFVCSPCCDRSGPFAEFDLLFLRYHRADGVRHGTAAGEADDFDFETSPRITLGYVGDDGVGARLRYWQYDHFQTLEVGAGTRGIGVDSYNLDFELFERFDLNCDWDVELSGGVRYSDQQEFMVDTAEADLRSNALNSAFGLIIGAEARRQISYGSLFARVRTAIVQGDKGVFNNDAGGLAENDVILLDSTSAQLELAVGHELAYQTRSGAEVFGRYGLEWWQYDNVSSSFNGALETSLIGASDIGYAGFMFGFGIRQ